MSSFIRRIQRMAKHRKTVWNSKSGTYRSIVVAGRNKRAAGVGSRLGVSNPKDKALLARLRREKARRQ